MIYNSKKSYNPKKVSLYYYAISVLIFFKNGIFKKYLNPLKTSLNIKNIDYIVIKVFLNSKD
jgi:hypothetical protein